jgi:DNA-binding MarR family transcriptional regulator
MDDSALPPERHDYESGLSNTDGIELRIWLRLLTCTNLMEATIRQRLAQSFDTTLPRFDVLAQLDRAGAPMSMGDLSRRLMVTNGNVTGLVDRLVREGLVERRPSPTDRRIQMVSLTSKGAKTFAAMAAAHRDWVGDTMTDLSRDEMARLFELLARLKDSILAGDRND